MADVVVIGAGVAGLSVATFLGDRHRVKVVDPQPGGKVRTLQRDGFRVENAANGWLDSEPAMTQLLAMLGLQQQVVLGRVSAPFEVRVQIPVCALLPVVDNCRECLVAQTVIFREAGRCFLKTIEHGLPEL